MDNGINNKIMNLLFLGDIIGRPGREAARKALPSLKEKYGADLVVANGENIGHGKGVTFKAVEEMKKAGVDLLTTGNHIWKKKDALSLVEQKDPYVLRPANYPKGVPGKGYRMLQIGAKSVLVINLAGRVFMHESFDCPFRKLDEILQETKLSTPDIVIVDFHAEATSEKKAFGIYADGKVSAVLGTHTHIQTADEQILPKGTAHISDVGMVGPKYSVLGVSADDAIKGFLYQMHQGLEISQETQIEICGVWLKIEENKVKSIERIREVVDI